MHGDREGKDNSWNRQKKQPGDKRGSMQNPDENRAKLRWRKESRNIAKKKLITFSSLYIEHYFRT